jgi:hypothetical protein
VFGASLVDTLAGKCIFCDLYLRLAMGKSLTSRTMPVGVYIIERLRVAITHY